MSLARHARSLFALALTFLVLAGPAPAQRPLEPRWRPDKGRPVRVHRGQDPTQIVLKLSDDCGSVARERRLSAAPGGRDVSVVAGYLEGLGVLGVERLFPLDDGLLQAMRREGERTSGRELCDMTQYYVVELPTDFDRARARAVIADLFAMGEVEDAYARPLPPPAPGGTTTPLYESFQDYRESASGIDADYAETVTGGDGAGITICDLEYSWNLTGMFGDTATHEDLVGLDSQSPAPALGSTSSWVDPFNDTNHGTAVAGILKGDANSFGVKGIAGGADLRVRAVMTTQGRNVALAVLRAAAALQSGDVILIEQQDFGPNYDFTANPPTQFGLLPVEVNSAEFNAIRQATALCIHVVEAAGNGSQDLDSANGGWQGCPGTCTGDPSYPLLFDPGVRDSGAILVGSSRPTASHERTWSTNYGRRLDAFSWGEGITTLGYGDLFDGGGGTPDPDRLYTQTFGGTSGASAIVAGAVASLSGVHRDRQRRTPIQPAAVRQLFRSVGQESIGVARHWWSRQPHLAAQLPLLAQGRDPGLVFRSPTSQSLMGNAFAPLGDVDGDGVGDFLIAARGEANVQFWNAGAAYVCSGLDGDAIRIHRGQQVNEYMGWDLDVLGDVNGDGASEYIVPSPGLVPEVVRVHDGASGNVLYSIPGTSGSLGWAVASIGDVSGDGLPDYVLGDIQGGPGGTGQVQVRSGVNGFWIGAVNAPPNALWFGHSVAGCGDVDGDGVPDFVVGAWRDSTNGVEAGSATVVSGQTLTVLYQLFGDNAGDRFGHAVAGAGDVDGDGLGDLIVGAPRDDDGGTSAGRARVYRGTTGALLYTYDGAAPFDELGTSVAGLGDMDGDGLAEFAIGAPYADTGAGTNAGAVYVHRGRRGTVLWTYQGLNAGDWFGMSVESAGDVSGDGLPDFAVGATAHNGGAGREMLFLAPPNKRLKMQPSQ